MAGKGLKNELAEKLSEAIKKLSGTYGDFEMPAIILENPKDKGHGDFASNAAMVLAGKLKKKPREIAAAITETFKCDLVEKTEIAGPGFINFFLTPAAWHTVIKDVISEGEKFGSSDLGAGKRCNIEFVSANPTGPLHIGHGRGAVVGDVLANVLEFAGFDVTREYYVNDFGNQMDKLGKSLKFRYLEALGMECEFPEGGYPGDYLKEIAEELKAQNGKSLLASDDAFFSKTASVRILKIIQDDLKTFRVGFDIWSSETKLHEGGEVAECVAFLRNKGIIYENDGALWLKSTDYGDEKDRVVIRQNGLPTYLASDISYHRDKYERKYDLVIDIWGADHHGYIPRMKSVIEAMGYDPSTFRVLLIQMVNLMRQGKPVAMGKREGEFVTMREVLDEVGVDACRYFFLERKSDAHLNFDLDLAREQSNKNPVYYVQYAHARIASVLRKAEEAGIDLNDLKSADLSLLKNGAELEILKKINAFRDVVELMASSFEPHHLTFYLKELVSLFHSYYYDNPIVGEDRELTRARLLFVTIVKMVIARGLKLLNVLAPERM
ncbi:MAG: arginine--tRNA ligase [Candidatus Schekmanbacteria bacterium]|nr:arginine--tRNA ligase [Candidatus Schekmanbacteria bacterium]